MAMMPNSISMETAGISDLIKIDYRWYNRNFRSHQYPNGMTVEPENLKDQGHFKKTYRQSRNRLREIHWLYSKRSQWCRKYPDDPRR